MNKKIIIGLTGQTGAGKSTFSALLAQRGAAVIDADLVARGITARADVSEKLCESFGADILKNGKLDRRILASRAFASPEKTELLNSITHPPILEEILRLCEEYFRAGKETVIVDAAALFESGGDRMCDLVASVICPENIRAQRIMSRDGITREQAMLRINAQQSENFYTDRADVILKNFPPFEPENELLKLLEAAERIRHE